MELVLRFGVPYNMIALQEEQANETGIDQQRFVITTIRDTVEPAKTFDSNIEAELFRPEFYNFDPYLGPIPSTNNPNRTSYTTTAEIVNKIGGQDAQGKHVNQNEVHRIHTGANVDGSLTMKRINKSAADGTTTVIDKNSYT